MIIVSRLLSISGTPDSLKISHISISALYQDLRRIGIIFNAALFQIVSCYRCTWQARRVIIALSALLGIKNGNNQYGYKRFSYNK